MQLPRVVIAAVFFVIGALIAIPALMKTTGESRASGAPTTTSGSPTPTGTATGASPTATRTPASPTPTRTSPSPTKPAPTATRTSPTPAPPAQPLRVTIGSVKCPGRTVDVTVRNTGTQNQDYGIERDDDSASVPGRIGPGATRTTTIKLRENRRTRVQVTWKNEPLQARVRTADCTKASPKPTRTRDQLPETGADDTVLWARAATGGAAMVTGVIIFWYGGIWPRRRDKALAGGRKSGD